MNARLTMWEHVSVPKLTLICPRRSVEARLNSSPNFLSKVIDDDGSSHGIHFLGLFSKKKDAIPLLFIHGWPGILSSPS